MADDVKVLREMAAALTEIADRIGSASPKPDFTLARQVAVERFKGHPMWKRLLGTPWENDAPTIAAELMCMYSQQFRNVIEREAPTPNALKAAEDRGWNAGVLDARAVVGRVWGKYPPESDEYAVLSEVADALCALRRGAAS